MDKFACPLCNKGFSTSSNLVRHVNTIHGETKHHCNLCTYSTERKDHLNRHYALYHKSPISPPSRKRVHEEKLNHELAMDSQIPGPSNGSRLGESRDGHAPGSSGLSSQGHQGQITIGDPSQNRLEPRSASQPDDPRHSTYVPDSTSIRVDQHATNQSDPETSTSLQGLKGRYGSSVDHGQRSGSTDGLAVSTQGTEEPTNRAADMELDTADVPVSPEMGSARVQVGPGEIESGLPTQGLEEEEAEEREDTVNMNNHPHPGLQEEEPDIDDGAIDQLLSENRRWMQTYRNKTRRIQDRYNFELVGNDMGEVRRYVEQIFAEATHPFKLNAAFGFVLSDPQTDKLRYYYASRNNRIFESPVQIREPSDVRAFMDRFEILDVLEYARNMRPDTKYIVLRVTNVLFYVDKLVEFGIGYEENLPDYVRRRSCVISLNRDNNSQVYRDAYCLFRCYHYHLKSNQYPKTTDIEALVRKYCTAWNLPMGRFPGVPLSALRLFEETFNINVEVYQLHERINEVTDRREVRASRRWHSLGRYDDTMNLNLFNHHFSYILDLRRYSDCWECRNCSKLFSHRGHLKEHEHTCNTTTKIVFPGGGYGLPKTIFELLIENGIDVSLDLRFFPFRLSFDFEALSVPIEDDRGKKEQFMTHQVPASVSVASNVPGYETPRCFISSGDPNALVGDMYEYMCEISAASYEILSIEYQTITSELYSMVAERDYLKEQSRELSENGQEQEADQYANEAYALGVYENLARRLDQWLRRIPALGFNSGRYDFNLIRSYLFPYFVENDIHVDIIKKTNDYLSVSTADVIFLDVCNFTAAGTSYAQWLKSNGVSESKGIFPYSWFTSLDLLDQDHLPPIESFYSNLRQCGISDQDYENLKQIWRGKGFSSMRDLLSWYNNQDVGPFLSAAQKMFDLWRQEDIDCFKSGIISLPGLSLAYLMKAMQPHTILPLCDENSADVYQTMRDNITGGLSIVMHRYHERDVTRLPNGDLCKYIYSHDANSLYLWALGEPTGTGLFAVWRPKAGSEPGVSLDWISPRDRDPETDDENRNKWVDTAIKNLSMTLQRKQAYPYSRSEVNWLEWTSHVTGRKIDHRFNGREKVLRVARNIHYRLDGFHPETQTAYQFHGCYWHGHDCRLNRARGTHASETRRRKTEEITTLLKDRGLSVVEKWECEWYAEMKSNPHIFTFLEENLNLQLRSNSLTGFQLLGRIQDGSAFGLVEVDIEVPWFDDDLLEYYAEFPPICKKVKLGRDQLGEHMKEYAEEHGYMKQPTDCLINSYFAKRILLSTPLIQWYMEHGMHVTRVYQFIEMKPKACFSKIRDDIAEHRRKADANPDYAPTGNSWKTVGNSCYGKSMTRKDRHKKTVLVGDEKAVKLVNSKQFNKMEECGTSAYEVCLDKDKIKIDLPLTVALFVYQYAKMKMLDYVYNFFKKYLKPGSFQLICSDTDSLFAAYAAENIDELVKDELKEEYFNTAKKQYLATCDYSKRTPGLLKEEWGGIGIVALCSKTYLTWNEKDEKKISSKGLSKRNNFSKEDYWKVLTTKVKGSGTNYGFRVRGDQLLQYRQEREGLAYLYAKREVQADGISTKPLYI